MLKTIEAGRLGDGPASGFVFGAEVHSEKYANSPGKSSASLANMQASWLAARARISLDHARAVRELAFPGRPA